MNDETQTPDPVQWTELRFRVPTHLVGCVYVALNSAWAATYGGRPEQAQMGAFALAGIPLSERVEALPYIHQFLNELTLVCQVSMVQAGQISAEKLVELRRKFGLDVAGSD